MKKIWVPLMFVALIAGLLWTLQDYYREPGPEPEATPELAHELDSPGPWLNSPPLKLADLRGKVVLLDIFEYTCVNCIRTIPYLQQWQTKYGPQGLVIIGVHTPEFDLGKDPANVRKGLDTLGITWPVVLDNQRYIWDAYRNTWWPHKVLIDANGFIRFKKNGEGAYESTETEIQQLLKEANPAYVAPAAPMNWAREEDKPGAVCYPRTDETYANTLYAQFAHGMMDEVETHEDPGNAEDGAIVLQGHFHVSRKNTVHTRDTPDRFADYVGLKFHASEVNAVFGYSTKATDGTAYRVYVTLNDRPVPPGMKGEDMKYDPNGRTYINVTSARMYNLIGGKEYGTYALKLYTDSAKFALYVFTFGSCLIPDPKPL